MRKFFSLLVGIVVIVVMLAGCTGTSTTSTTKAASPSSTAAAPTQSASSTTPPKPPSPASTSAAPPPPASSSTSAAPKPPAPPASTSTGAAYSQYKRTVGLIKNDPAKAFPGYTLFSPKHMGSTYLINNKGELINKWSGSQWEPGQSFYLRENGNLVRTAQTRGALSSGGGEGGRIEEYDWSGKLVWSMDFSTNQFMQHHDIAILPNNNIIMLVVERKSYADAIQAGFDPKNLDPEIKQQNYMVPDAVYEIKPKMPSGYEIVWEWHTWDHLVQNFDKTKDNYGIPSEHPELVDPNGDHKRIPSFWNHMNSIAYNAKWDQIMMSVRGNSELWVIDHSTTTAQAKEHTGGKYNKGGDLLYRWGNPQQYDRGTAADQKYYQQHNAIWIDDNLPGAGNIMVYNNGLGRRYSSVDEFKPDVDANGNYKTPPAGQPFGPKDYTWTYKATPPESMYDGAISGSQRLPNGNTLIDSGTHGRFIEVTPAGETVWEYINPVVYSPMGYADTVPSDPARPEEFMNACFRVLRYPVDFAGFKGKDMSPKGFIELDAAPGVTKQTGPSGGPGQKPPPPGGQPPPPGGGQPPPPPGGGQPPPPPGGAQPPPPGDAPPPGPTATPGATAPNPMPKSTGTMKLTSSVVKDGGDIPEKYSRQGAKNGLTTVSLPLSWTGAPAGTKSFAVIGWNGVIFWALYNIPGSATGLAEDTKGVGTEMQKFITPSEGGPGTFVKHITLYALSDNVNVSGTDVEALRKALNAVTLDSAELKYNMTVQ